MPIQVWLYLLFSNFITNFFCQIIFNVFIFSGRSPLIGYTLEYFSFDLETGWVVAAHRVTSETYTIHNLKPDTSYVFLVRAENSDGLSHPSPVSERVRTLRLIGSDFVHEDDQPIDLAEVQNTLLSKVVELSSVEAISSTGKYFTYYFFEK